MNFNDSKMVDKEIEITKEVLNRHVYPEYEDVVKIIQNNMELFSEYGRENHWCMYYIWDFHFEHDDIKKMGEETTKRGGFQAMQANYYTLLHVFRTLYKNELESLEVLIAWRTMRDLINVAWHGVGDWRM